MSSSIHDLAGAGAADQTRDGEHRAVLSTAFRLKALEIVRDVSAGATAGAVSRVLTAPLDVTKIRFQLDHAVTRRYNCSVWAAMRSIYGEEGLITLWRGNLPAMILWSAYTGVQFCAYEQLRTVDFLNSYQNSRGSSSGSGSSGRYTHRFSTSAERSGGRGGGGVGGSEEAEARRCEGREQEWHRRRGRGRGLPPALSNFVYGSIAAFTATLATYPLDLTRTALAFQGVPKRYDSMSAFMSRTLREGGVRGLFRGVTPTLAMITPQMGVSFAAWEALKANPPAFVVAASATSAVSWQLSAGAIAGMAGKLVMFPLDTVKKRVQTAGMLERDVAYGVLPKYAGPVHALKTVLKEEGALALFRGSVPAMWKSGFSTAATYAVYEWVRAGTSAALDREQ